MNINLENEFKRVSYKRKGKIKKTTIKNTHLDISTESFDLETNLRKISAAKEELLSTDLYKSTKALLKQGLTHLDNPTVSKIICFGLGRISERIPRYQLALLLCLKDMLKSEITAYDPVFNHNDEIVLKKLDVHVETDNLEGKFPVKDTVLFYLPHCPKQLMNNLLWTNWTAEGLNKCIIIGNSISQVIQDNFNRDLNNSARYLDKISPYVLELQIVNSFKFFEVFSDTSIHCFPVENVQCVNGEFWSDCDEPVYANDVEFITNCSRL